MRGSLIEKTEKKGIQGKYITAGTLELLKIIKFYCKSRKRRRIACSLHSQFRRVYIYDFSFF